MLLRGLEHEESQWMGEYMSKITNKCLKKTVLVYIPQPNTDMSVMTTEISSLFDSLWRLTPEKNINQNPALLLLETTHFGVISVYQISVCDWIYDFVVYICIRLNYRCTINCNRQKHVHVCDNLLKMFCQYQNQWT